MVKRKENKANYMHHVMVGIEPGGWGKAERGPAPPYYPHIPFWFTCLGANFYDYTITFGRNSISVIITFYTKLSEQEENPWVLS